MIAKTRITGKEKPLVSIIIPVYNGGNYLSEAVESALGQTYTNCEVLVVNDGSDDQGATARIAASFGDRIRYFEKENGGVASALNMGIDQMRGEYFAWLSHDDIYRPEKIEMQVKAVLSSGDRTRLVQGEYEFYHMPTGTRTPTDFHKLYKEEQICRSFFSVLWLQSHACSALIHRSHFERVGRFDEAIRTVQDVEMWFRLFRKQHSLFIPQILHSVREHPEAGSNTISCYHEETGRIYWRLIEELDFLEMGEVFVNAPTFLCRMEGFLKSYGRKQEAWQVKRLLERAPAFSKGEEEASIEGFHRRLEMYSGGKRRKIAIFGAGQYGKRIKFELESRLVNPDVFIDNSQEKWGKSIDGLPCVSMEEACHKKNELLVVIAQRTLMPALSQIINCGFPYFITKQSLEAEMLHVLPAMSRMQEWLSDNVLNA